MKIIAILALLFVTVYNQVLRIQGPTSAFDSYVSGNSFNFTVANYGLIPWGQRVFAPVIIPEVQDACQELPPIEKEDYHGIAPIVLVKRGNCKFTKKSRNVQNAGGKLALIYDDRIEESSFIQMGDDGSGDSVYIPSVFISEQNGENLEKLIKQTQSKEQNLLISLNFGINKSVIVDLGIFINLPDERPQFFIDDFREVYHRFLENSVNLYPVYQFIKVVESDKGYREPQDDCLGGGRYCCYDPDGPGTATGRQIAEEQLRQICVHREGGVEAWFDYMENFHLQERNPQHYAVESQNILKEICKDNKCDVKKINSCYTSSFANSRHETSENTILNQQLDIIENSGVFTWPAIHINNITYTGRYSAFAVEEAVCAASLLQNDRCKQVLNPFDMTNGLYGANEDGVSTWGIIGIIVTILVVLFAGILFGYKRWVKKEMKSEMKGQVNTMVSNYIKFYEAKQQDTENR